MDLSILIDRDNRRAITLSFIWSDHRKIFLDKVGQTSYNISMKKLSNAQILRNLTELEWLEIADTYKSASDYLRHGLNMSTNGRYIKFITDTLKDLDIEWLNSWKVGKEKRTCPVCDKHFDCYASEDKITCSYACSNTHFRSGENNGNYNGSGTNYRKHAFESYPHECSHCGLEDTRALQVHHIDHCHQNNDLKNLVILCANCHLITHSV